MATGSIAGVGGGRGPFQPHLMTTPQTRVQLGAVKGVGRAQDDVPSGHIPPSRFWVLAPVAAWGGEAGPPRPQAPKRTWRPGPATVCRPETRRWLETWRQRGA